MNRTTILAVSVVVVSIAALGVASASASDAPALSGALTTISSPGGGVIWGVGVHNNGSGFIVHRTNGRWHQVTRPAVGAAGDISALTTGGDQVWVGGYRQTKATKSLPPHDVPVLETRKGGAWVAQPLHAKDGEVDALAASSATNAWAVGNLDDLADVHDETEHWDGASWLPVPVPRGVEFSAVTTSAANNAWAIGTSGSVWQWDGTSWGKSLKVSKQIDLSGIATDASDDTVVVGSLTKSHRTHTYLAQYDGKSWQRVSVPDPHAYAELDGIAMHGGSAWAVGRSDVGRKSYSLIIHRSSKTWKVQKSPVHEGLTSDLATITAPTAKTAYAVGDYGTTETNAKPVFVLYKNGKWKTGSVS